MAYTWYKAFHIVGVVVWFAGLFYLVRLFVYHAEAESKPEPARTILKEQYALMESRLYAMICTPGAILAVMMGVGMLAVDWTWVTHTWLQVKLLFVVMLVVYHAQCGRWMRQLAAGTSTVRAARFRVWNEAPTLLLVAIVLLAVFKNALPAAYAALVMAALVVALLAAIRIYARIRQSRS